MLPLTPQQGYLVSRLDGHTDVAQLAQLIGQTTENVEVALAELVRLGAVEPSETPGQSAPIHDSELAANESESDETKIDSESETDVGTHRKRFAALAALPDDERVLLARQAVEPNLSALCFDALPKVIAALLENSNFGLKQARLIARHHHNPVGLDALVARAAFSSDGEVRRALLSNTQLSSALFRRLWQSKRLLEIHQLSVSREIPEQTKRGAKELLRTRFSSGQAEERVELLVKTEGRCLTALSGLSIDGKTTSLLCARSIGSTLFVQNLARWSAAPPALIAHLLRQELVKRSPMLRTLLERHPNAPK
jgi:hypothetical protein